MIYPVASERKQDLLIHLIENKNMSQVLVFTRTKRRADQLTQRLERKGIRVVALHSDKTQGARTKALESFRKGTIQILVATNIAARGLDVKGISHVVNYEFPETPEEYIHRIGRTARHDATGDAISLVSFEEQSRVREVERLLGQKIPRENVPGLTNTEKIVQMSGWRSFGPRRFGGGGRKRSMVSR